MTTEAIPAPMLRVRHARFDLSGAVMVLFAAVLCLLVVLPIGWLVVFAFTDKTRTFTLANFATLFTDPVFVEPLLTTLIIATSVSLVCCAVAAPLGWIVARSDMPLRRTIRVLVMASFVTPPFLGAIAWELLAAPNSGLLNQLYRSVTGADADVRPVRHLHAHRASSSSSPATPSPTCSCWSPMRSTASPAISRTPPPCWAAAPGARPGA